MTTSGKRGLPAIKSIGIPLECFKMPRRFASTATSAEYARSWGNLAGFVERNGEYPAAEPLHRRTILPPLCVTLRRR
jgi:hypothetical protein